MNEGQPISQPKPVVKETPKQTAVKKMADAKTEDIGAYQPGVSEAEIKALQELNK